MIDQPWVAHYKGQVLRIATMAQLGEEKAGTLLGDTLHEIEASPNASRDNLIELLEALRRSMTSRAHLEQLSPRERIIYEQSIRMLTSMSTATAH